MSDLQIQFQLLVLVLSLFLIPDILPDHFLVQSHGIYTIPLRPKMIPPIRLLPQLPILVEHFHRSLTLDPSHQIRYRDLGGNHYYQVNMILLNIQAPHFTTSIPTDRLDTGLQRFPHVAYQYPITVFGYPGNMILTMPYGV